MKLGLQVVAFDWPGSPANTGPTLLASVGPPTKPASTACG